jgi:uncharacterized protein (TIGR03086 family)
MDHALAHRLVQAVDAPPAGLGEDRAMTEHPSRGSTDDELTRLIRHGRDREAVVLALHEHPYEQPLPNRGAPMDPRDQMDQIVPLLEGVATGLTPDQLNAPTPCANFTVRGVLEHMIGGASLFTAAFRGEAPPDAVPAGDPITQFPKTMAGLRDAIRSDGALDRTIDAPFGQVPGEMFARFVALDGLVHGWDLATATGQAYDPPTELVEEVDGFARQAIADPMRDGDTFAAAVEPPADATAMERLAAFTGRTVPAHA